MCLVSRGNFRFSPRHVVGREKHAGFLIRNSRELRAVAEEESFLEVLSYERGAKGTKIIPLACQLQSQRASSKIWVH